MTNKRIEKYKQKTVYIKFISSFFKYVLLIGLSFIILYPFLVKFSSVPMSIDDVADKTVMFIPRHPTLFNLETIISQTNYWKSLAFTGGMSIFVAVLQTLFCSIIGYGFAKFKFRGNNIVFALVIFTMIVPPQALQLPYFFSFKEFDPLGVFSLFINGPKFNLLDSLWPMALISVTGLGFKNGLYVFMMRQFFGGVPNELSEAAEVDGSGVFRTFFSIMLPQAGSMMLTIFLFSFSWSWTDQYYSSIFFPNMDVLSKVIGNAATVTINNSPLQSGTMLSSVMLNTAAVLVIAPLLIIYLFAQKRFIQGVESSGIVG